MKEKFTRDRRHEPGPPDEGRVTAGHDDVAAVERAEHGGIKWGSAFFGWLTAVGVAVLLTALLGALGPALGLGTMSGEELEAQARQNAETIGVVGGVVLLVILFLAYYCGGYVAGRMARFDGAKQGVAVWVWAIVIALLVAGLAALAGSQYNVLSELESFPRIPIDEGDLTVGGIVAVALGVLVPLVAAVLGGLAGMRYHRRVDRTGLRA